MKAFPEGGRRFLMAKAMLLAAGLVAAVFLSVLNGNLAEAESPGPPASVKAENEGSAKEGAKPGFEELKGRWHRPDGGYIIEIKNVDASGKMDVAYFNPKPINVSKAEATREGSATKVFIELRDVGYPGCAYTLTYDPQTDQLRGVYFQAAIQKNFEVVFVRIK
ncbi:MAG: hypothetical protein ACLP5H_03260 [Desulfomonilaceae bacterium]